MSDSEKPGLLRAFLDRGSRGRSSSGDRKPISHFDPFSASQTPDSSDNGAHDLERVFKRGLLALPLLALSVLAYSLINVAPATPFAMAMLDGGEIKWDNGSFRVPILHSFYNVPWLDKLVSCANMFFMPVIYGYDPASRMQAVSFLSDGGVMLAIWWLESLRCRPMPWFLHNPSILTLASQLVGLGVVCPLYCFLSYIYAPIDSPVSSDQRSSLTAVLPALLVGYYIPAYAMFFWPDLAERQSWLFLWQLYPVLISIAYHAVTLGTATPRNRSVVAKLSRDLLAVRVCIGVSVVLGASVWLWTRFSAPLSMATIFAPTGVPRLSLPSLTAFSGQFLRWDEVFVFGPMLLWLAYLYEDTKRAGLLQASWLSLIPLAAAAVIALGPGAAVGLGWLWREEAILARHEKDTLMLEVAAKVDALLKANGA